MTPTHLHARAVAYVARQLRRRGCAVRRIGKGGIDLAVGEQTIAVRVARPGVRAHRVTVAGRSYRYRYRVTHWNLHAHARVLSEPPAVWVLVEVGGPVYVVPAGVLRGKTVSLLAGAKRTRRPAAVRAWRGAWGVVAGRRRDAA